VLTHCNTGALATGGVGTALAVVTTAWDQGRRFEVFADETRPLLQGARLTAWELVQRGIPVTVLCDGAAAALLATGRVASCIVGADRIAANGDTANKIGTYGLALLAAAHQVPVPLT
jgi:methylthioribose-1-phosphate isomerase